MPVFGTHGQPLQRRRRDRAVPGAAAAPGRAGPEAQRRPPAARSTTRHSTHQVPIVPGARARYLAEIADTVRGYKQRALASRRSWRARSSSCAQRPRMLQRRQARQRAPRRRGRARPRRHARGAARRRRAASCSRCGRDMQQAYAGDEYVVKIRDKEIRTALTHTTLVGHARSARSRCRSYEDHGEILKWLLLDNVPGSFPVHRRHLRVQARGRRPDAHVRRRRRRLPHQPALQAAVRRHAGQAPVDRLRLGHAVRQRPATCGPTSTARSATPASRSRRSTT